MISNTTIPNTLAPQYEYVGDGAHRVKQLAVVNHAGIKADTMLKIETEGTNLVRKIIAEQAKVLHYDSPESLCSYAGYVNTYQKEAMSFIAWRGAVWDWVQTYIQGVLGGTIIPPSDLNVLIKDMPKYVNYVVV